MPNCQLCGEPMPEGETMFKFHGYSGPCPKPPLPSPKVEAHVEIVHVRSDDGCFYIQTVVNGKQWDQVGPFATESERKRATDDLLKMLRSGGATDTPAGMQ
jgi:hypothetical protein